MKRVTGPTIDLKQIHRACKRLGWYPDLTYLESQGDSIYLHCTITPHEAKNLIGTPESSILDFYREDTGWHWLEQGMPELPAGRVHFRYLLTS